MEEHVYVTEPEQPWENWYGVLVSQGKNVSLIENNKGEIVEVNNDYWEYAE